MIELGAGFGAKLVNAYTAAHIYHGRDFPCYLVGVEAEPTHFKWMKQNFQDNNIDFMQHKLINAAVSGKDGRVYFEVGFPGCYGQRVVYRKFDFRCLIKKILAVFIPHFRNSIAHRGEIVITDYWTGNKATGVIKKVKVRAVSLSSLFRDLDFVDLVDLDIQGSELGVLKSAQNDIDKKVRMVYVGTHSNGNESGLRRLFKNLGWKCLYDYPGGGKRSTPYGEINFQDGVQAWINPNKD